MFYQHKSGKQSFINLSICLVKHLQSLGLNDYFSDWLGVAVDRFLVISRPMDKKPTRTRAYITVAIIWVYAGFFAGMPLVGIGKYVPEGYLTSCSFDYLSNDVWTRVFIFIFFIGAWLYPLSVISFCYAAIIRAVYHVRLNVITADGASTATPEVTKRNRTDTSADTNTTTRRTSNQLFRLHFHFYFNVFVYLAGVFIQRTEFPVNCVSSK